MSLKNAFKPTGGKVLGIIIILALTATYGFIPVITNPEVCMGGGCIVEIGLPYVFLFYNLGEGEAITDFNTIVFIIDIVVFYLAICLISLIFEIGRRKNVPNSNSGGRDSSPTDQAGTEHQELR
jgi:hypothetical protein